MVRRLSSESPEDGNRNCRATQPPLPKATWDPGTDRLRGGSVRPRPSRQIRARFETTHCTRQLDSFSPRDFLEASPNEDRVAGLNAIFLSELRGPFGKTCAHSCELAILRSIARRRHQKLRAFGIDHQHAGAIVQEKRCAHLPDFVAQIALRIRFDFQAIVKTIGLAQGRDHSVGADGFTAYFHGAERGSANGGAGRIHDQALALQQTKTAPEEIRAEYHRKSRP
jgi:hypothetical protein